MTIQALAALAMPGNLWKPGPDVGITLYCEPEEEQTDDQPGGAQPDTQEPENLMLRMLRRVDANVADVREDMREVKGRLSAIDGHMALFLADIATQAQRVDRLEARVGRLERRLELTDE